jgi:hypothetical protein
MAKRNAPGSQQQGAGTAAPPAAAPAADPVTQGLQEAEALQRVALRQSMGLLLRQLRAYNGTVASLRGQEAAWPEGQGDLMQGLLKAMIMLPLTAAEQEDSAGEEEEQDCHPGCGRDASCDCEDCDCRLDAAAGVPAQGGLAGLLRPHQLAMLAHYFK